jgi:hypothetical protein
VRRDSVYDGASDPHVASVVRAYQDAASARDSVVRVPPARAASLGTGRARTRAHRIGPRRWTNDVTCPFTGTRRSFILKTLLRLTSSPHDP